jgi:hypothetical protein
MRWPFLVVMLAASGCMADAEKNEKVSNKSVKVEVLFTDDEGFTVKRFYDGHYRYYVTPAGRTLTDYQQGKNHRVREDVDTVTY